MTMYFLLLMQLLKVIYELIFFPRSVSTIYLQASLALLDLLAFALIRYKDNFRTVNLIPVLRMLVQICINLRYPYIQGSISLFWTIYTYIAVEYINNIYMLSINILGFFIWYGLYYYLNGYDSLVSLFITCFGWLLIFIKFYKNYVVASNLLRDLKTKSNQMIRELQNIINLSLPKYAANHVFNYITNHIEMPPLFCDHPNVVVMFIKFNIPDTVVDKQTEKMASNLNFYEDSTMNADKTKLKLLDRVIRQMDNEVKYSHVFKVEHIGYSYIVSSMNVRYDYIKSDFDLKTEVQTVAIFGQRATRICKMNNIDITIGMHVGPLAAGLIGKTRTFFRLFGDTINTTSRMQSTSKELNKIHMTAATFQYLKSSNLIQNHEECLTEVKGKGLMKTFLVEIKPTKGYSSRMSIYKSKKGKYPSKSFRTNSSSIRASVTTDVPVINENEEEFLERDSDEEELYENYLANKVSEIRESNFMKKDSTMIKKLSIINNKVSDDENNSPIPVEIPENEKRRISVIGQHSPTTFKHVVGKSLKNLIKPKHVNATHINYERDSFLERLKYKLQTTYTDVIHNTFITVVPSKTELSHSMIFGILQLVLITFMHYYYSISSRSVITIILFILSATSINLYCIIDLVDYVNIVFTILRCISICFLFDLDSDANKNVLELNFLQLVLLSGNDGLMIKNNLIQIILSIIVFLSNTDFHINYIDAVIAISLVTIVTEFIVQYKHTTMNDIRYKIDIRLEQEKEMMQGILSEKALSIVKNNVDDKIVDLWASVLHLDIVGFTSLSANLTPIEVAQFLHYLYDRFDTIVAKYNLYKVDTVGDAYIVIRSIDTGDLNRISVANRKDACSDLIDCAKDMIEEVEDINLSLTYKINIRVGISAGLLTGAVLGELRPRFHVYGEILKDAEFFESNASPGTILCSPSILRFIDTTYNMDKITTKPNQVHSSIGYQIKNKINNQVIINMEEFEKRRRPSKKESPHISPHMAPSMTPHMTPFESVKDFNPLSLSSDREKDREPSNTPSLERKFSSVNFNKSKRKSLFNNLIPSGVENV